MSNPYDATFSSYLTPNGTSLIDRSGVAVRDQSALHYHQLFRAKIGDRGKFPCHLGGSAIARGAYRFGFYPSMVDAQTIDGVAHDLWLFVQEQQTIGAGPQSPWNSSTFVACFNGPPADDVVFEENLWILLQQLHVRDVDDWDPNYDDDPSSASFAFSFAGRGFFVVGLHHSSRRESRRFPKPCLVFNAKFLFANLRQAGKFDQAVATIRQHEMKYAGAINPNLSIPGEAQQFSPRETPPGWQCPFRSKP